MRSDCRAGTDVAALEGLAKTFGGSEALAAALALSSKEAQQFVLNFQGIPTEVQLAAAEFLVFSGRADDVTQALKDMGIGLEGATERARAIQNASPAAQFALLKSSVDGVAIAIGQELLPHLTELATELIPIAEDITTWIKQNPELTEQILKMAVAAVILGPALVLVGSALSAIGVALGLILSPIGAAVIAVGVLMFAADKLLKALGFPGLVDAITNVIDNWKFIVDSAVMFIQDAWDGFWGSIEGSVNDFKLIIQNALNAIIDAVNPILEAMGVGKINRVTWIINVSANITEQAAAILGLTSAQVQAPIDVGPSLGDPGFGGNSTAPIIPFNLPEFAGGGQVGAGMPALVGERGPEIFWPDSAGTIIPNNIAFGGRGAAIAPVGGNGGRVIHIENVFVTGVEDIDQLADRLERRSNMRAGPRMQN